MKNSSNKDVKDIIVEAFNKMRIHDAARNLTLWAIDLPMAFYLADCVNPQWKTLETGCGLTTVALATLGTRHYCIVPNLDEVHRIRAYCDSKGLSLDKVNFIIERSEEALPKLSIFGFDLCLIDGRHGFPSPFIDFYHMAERLKLGGLLVVDDTCLWTGLILSKFLMTEMEWSRVKKFYNTEVFRKNGLGTHEKEWNAQPFVMNRSRLRVNLNHYRQMVQTIYRHLKSKEFGIIQEKVRRRVFPGSCSG